jgi:hypothetical protein
MATQLLATAAGSGRNSADFTLTEATLLTMKGQRRANGSKILIQLKLSDATYVTQEILQGNNHSGVFPAGIYRAVSYGTVGLERA